jgi:hypothetical protein
MHVEKIALQVGGVLAAPQGFEPRYSAPEADVLTVERGGCNHSQL